MCLFWSSEQIRLRNQVVDFAQGELNSDLADRDRRGEFRRELWEKCGRMGLTGVVVPEEYGGAGHDPLTAALLLEGLGYGSEDNGLNFGLGAHLWGCVTPILASGTHEQKSLYLPRLASGELIGALALTEQGAGSDAHNLETSAERKGDRYILNGTKIFITHGPVADVLLVFATTDRSKGGFGITCFLVDRSTAGLRLSRPVEKMGLRTVTMGEVHLMNCEVPTGHRLGPEGAGMALFAAAMEWERSLILAPAVGAMERQLEACVRYAKERRQFGSPIGKFQLVADKVVEMRLRLEASRLMLYKVGWLKKQDKSIPLEAAMAKLFISEAWVHACQEAIQLHGGSGYLVEEAFERQLRDAIGSKLYSGTSEIQRMIVSNHLGL